jgi:hypothetical protein
MVLLTGWKDVPPILRATFASLECHQRSNARCNRSLSFEDKDEL